MARRLSKAAKMEAVKNLGDWCLTVVRFYKDELDRQIPGLSAMFEGVIETSVADGNLRGLEMLARDYAEMGRSGTAAREAQLDELLKAKYGRGLKDDSTMTRIRVTMLIDESAMAGTRWSDEAIRARIVAMLQDLIGEPERDIRGEDHLVSTLNVNSDDLSFAFVPEVIEVFGINPPVDAWRDVGTVEDVVRFVRRCLPSASEGGNLPNGPGSAGA